MAETNVPPTTTDSGIPAASDEHSLTVGPAGPIALHDHYVVQKMQHFNRERVPERVVHAKGGGAHGFFEVTDDVTQFTKADFLSEVGKRTDMFARFSTVAGEQGFPDTVRDPRGFALKFYTERGQLRHGRQQHAGLLRPRPVEVPGLHPLPEAPARHRPALQRHAVGLLDALARERPPGHDPHVRPRDPATLAPHERLLQPHLLVGQRRRRAVLGQVPLQDRSRASRTSPRTRRRAMAGEDADFHRRDLLGAIAAGDAPGVDVLECRSCRSRTPRTTASTRST